MKNAKNIIKRYTSIVLSIAFVFSSFSSAVFAQTATTTSGVQAVTTGFSDVSRTHKYYVAIDYLNKSGAIKGYDDGTFKPEKLVNRAEAVKIILAGSEIAAAESFTQFFPDVNADHWFAPYVLKARELGFVKGNDTDGTFAPARQVNIAEFVKMLLAANSISTESFVGKTLVPNIDPNAWFAPYINYSAALGLIEKDAAGNVDPAKYLSRGEVASIMYLLAIIRKGSDTQFLLNQAEAEMAQIEVYIAANQITLAKSASELAVDITQQAYKNLPENNIVLGAAKIARAYDFLVDSFVNGVQGNIEEAVTMANSSIAKATEAWEANNATQPIAAHIKERSREILTQLGNVAPTTPAPTTPAPVQ